MPMLTTLRIGLPVWPFHSPAADPVGERGHPVEHLVHLLDDVDAVDDQRRAARHPQRDVQHGAVLGDVDPLAGEHRLDPLRQPGLLGQRHQQLDRLVGDPVLRVVEIQAGALGDQPLAPRRVGGEQVAQMQILDVLVVPAQPLPASALGQGGHAATAATWSSIRLNRSSHALTKLRAPSDWSVAASASTSMPADSNWASVASASPPSAAIGLPT